MMRTTFRLLPIAAVCSLMAACGGGSNTPSQTTSAAAATPAAPTLLVSRDTFDPTFTMGLGSILPINNTPEATSGSTIVSVPSTAVGFPNMFTLSGGSSALDPNFGVTADMAIDQWAPGATAPTLFMDVTQAAQQQGLEDITSSFSSKSEDALNLSQDGTAITFNEYNAPIDQLDRSNSNTPGVIDPSNTDVAQPTYRAVVQLNLASKTLQVTNTNGFSGNNGRASVLVNGQYYIIGNAGNSGSTPSPTYGIVDTLTMDTGVQTIAAGSSCAFSQVIGAFNTASGSSYAPAASGACSLGTITDANASLTYSKKTTGVGGNQFGFSLAQVSGQTADKTGKDDNFRGLYLGPDGTLYVSKGSGGNGVNTVFQVGTTGALASGQLPQTSAITPLFLPNGPTGVAATNLSTSANWQLSYGTAFPFGMWIPKSNPNIMFVADEGDLTSTGTSMTTGAAGGSGGLWVYQNSNGKWTPIAHLTQGLNMGTPYTVTDTKGVYGKAGASMTTQPDGLRNIAGQVNADGSFTLYAITSTVGDTLANVDEGVDPNQLVKITVNVNGSTVTPTGSGFSVMETAPYGQVLRGVALVPTTTSSN
ncbi:hypothetical protein [Trinickia dinghuensis]|uniref:DUF839 domain-containing protein n=1 Tax=Trinickia dinghuensis TaxID=2291023 RepID=A0A3D8K7M8_9BURK|nr:hypothetical protein [Trinickia dinghuensis]RDV00896.1 hypothetical protein DWV00_03980 [Trinickia dinghuensis]